MSGNIGSGVTDRWFGRLVLAVEATIKVEGKQSLLGTLRLCWAEKGHSSTITLNCLWI